MMPARFVLFVTGGIFAAYGAFCLFKPMFPAESMGLDPGAMSTAALVEFRAMYGGLQMALGILFILAASIERWLHSGLWLLVILLGSLALARTLGACIDGEFDNVYTRGALFYEWITFLFGVAALKFAPGTFEKNHAAK